MKGQYFKQLTINADFFRGEGPPWPIADWFQDHHGETPIELTPEFLWHLYTVGVYPGHFIDLLTPEGKAELNTRIQPASDAFERARVEDQPDAILTARFLYLQQEIIVALVSLAESDRSQESDSPTSPT